MLAEFYDTLSRSALDTRQGDRARPHTNFGASMFTFKHTVRYLHCAIPETKQGRLRSTCARYWPSSRTLATSNMSMKPDELSRKRAFCSRNVRFANEYQKSRLQVSKVTRTQTDLERFTLCVIGQSSFLNRGLEYTR